jgi:hypothetical protein
MSFLLRCLLGYLLGLSMLHPGENAPIEDKLKHVPPLFTKHLVGHALACP